MVNISIVIPPSIRLDVWGTKLLSSLKLFFKAFLYWSNDLLKSLFTIVLLCPYSFKSTVAAAKLDITNPSSIKSLTISICLDLIIKRQKIIAIDIAGINIKFKDIPSFFFNFI